MKQEIDSSLLNIIRDFLEKVAKYCGFMQNPF